MKRALLVFGILIMASSTANAGGLVSKHASSVQLTVDAARSQATRIGASFSISGSNIDTTDGPQQEQSLLALLLLEFILPVLLLLRKTQQVLPFHSVSHILKADAVPASAPTVGDVPNFSNLTSYTAGTCWNSSWYCNFCRSYHLLLEVLVLRQQDNLYLKLLLLIKVK